MIAFLIETTHNLVNTLLHFGEGIILETSTLETLYWWPMYIINSVDQPIKVILYRRDGGGGGRGVIKVKDSDLSNMHLDLGSHCC